MNDRDRNPILGMLFAQVGMMIAMALVLVLPASAGNYAHSKAAPASDIVEIASSSGDFKTLAAALEAAGLVPTLKGDGPFTVFAPTDEAFAQLPAGTVESLLRPENKDQLIAVLTYHVVPGKVMAADVVKVDSAKTVNGQALSVKTRDGGVRINDATVTRTDIVASNGVIHVVDSVILPPAG